MRRARLVPTADAGQASVLVVGLVAVAAALTVALGHVAGGAVDDAAAQHAADAAALAGAASGAGEAERVAAANGAVLVSVSSVGGDVIVTVEVHGRRATARASTSP
ncbi:MAG: hypothetical protein IPM43_07605 [Actinomycetota bacterium]|nr:MAG: hypothetical protein IPM43_07605 [Actinomycetota bacterium]